MGDDGGRAYYFGCWGESGHHLFGSDGDAVARATRLALPPELQPGRLDTGYCPPGDQDEGAAALHHVAGFTVLAFWDRSVDRRRGSHSTFVLRGTLGFDAAVDAARAAFPTVWARFSFAVAPAGGGETVAAENARLRAALAACAADAGRLPDCRCHAACPCSSHAAARALAARP